MYLGRDMNYFGASPLIMQKLVAKKGIIWSLPKSWGYVRNHIASNPISEIEVSDTLKHPKTVASFKDFEPIKDWESLRVES